MNRRQFLKGLVVTAASPAVVFSMEEKEQHAPPGIDQEWIVPRHIFGKEYERRVMDSNLTNNQNFKVVYEQSNEIWNQFPDLEPIYIDTNALSEATT